MKNYYGILGIGRGAGKQDIKKAYRNIAKKYHPDSNCARTDGGGEFAEATEAYETLNDDSKRREYDRNLRGQEPATRSSRSFRSPDHMRSYRPVAPLEDITPPPDNRPYRTERFLELVLTPAQAAAGGPYSFSISARVPCPRCRDGGLFDQFFCSVCSGGGSVQMPVFIRVQAPPGVREGWILKQSISISPGVTLHLTMVIRIE